MQDAGPFQEFQLGFRQVEFDAGLSCQPPHPLGVAAGIVVLGVNRVGQGPHRFDRGLLQAAHHEHVRQHLSAIAQH
jgi:hypothetical protein